MILVNIDSAAFDAVGRDHDFFCLPDTRTDHLRDNRSWLHNKSAGQVYCLSRTFSYPGAAAKQVAFTSLLVHLQGS